MGGVVRLRTTAHIRSRLSGQQAQPQWDGLVSHGNFLSLSHYRLLHHHPIIPSIGHLLVGRIVRDVPTYLVPPLLLQESCSRGGERPNGAGNATNLLQEAESSLGPDHHTTPIHGELPGGLRERHHPGTDHRHIPDTVRTHQGILR